MNKNQFQSSFSLNKDSEVDNSGTDSVNTLESDGSTYGGFTRASALHSMKNGNVRRSCDHTKATNLIQQIHKHQKQNHSPASEPGQLSPSLREHRNFIHRPIPRISEHPSKDFSSYIK